MPTTMRNSRREQRERWLDAIPLGTAWRALPSDPEVFRPDSVRDRLCLYRALLDKNPAPFLLGDHGERHIFWGYAAQLQWQAESGRLGRRVGSPTDQIDPHSWWGAMNATLCLLPICAAVRAGVLDPVEVLSAGDPLRPHEGDFAPATRRWTDFFCRVASVHNEDDWEAARVEGWRAHVASIEAGIRVFAPAFRRLPIPEQHFGRGWTRMVDFFGKAALRTDLEAIARFRSSLPPRPLQAWDRPGSIGDFDRATNDATRRIVDLALLSRWRFALRRRLWNRSMRDPVLREESLDILFGDRAAAPEIKRRFRHALLPGPVLP